jgi:hypothetical protein
VNPNFIPGIYNYCDRWCERCTFCSRCRNYEHTSTLTPEENDISNKAFWDRISNNFKEAARLLREAANSYGIDLDAVSGEEAEEYTRNRKNNEQTAREHPLAKTTLQYITKGRKLLEQEEIMKDKAEELLQHFETGLQSREETTAQANNLKECQEVISWYLHFIHVKFMRALMGKAEDDGWEEANGFQKDSDGSAKIALIAIDRSIEAWITLLQLIPAAEDGILSLLALLQKSRRIAESEFPDARKFIRPGFDEP